MFKRNCIKAKEITNWFKNASDFELKNLGVKLGLIKENKSTLNNKKILITSGGTKIKIDRVRSITNMSKGTFGSQIAESFAKVNQNIPITYLGAYESKMPFFQIRIEKKNGENQKVGYDSVNNLINIVAYETFEDYQNKLFSLIKEEKPDIIILAAAVSDYGVENYVDGKIRTTSDDMVIRLKPLPKLISKVRELAPNSFIVGFKLLVDSTEDELKEACVNSMKTNRLNMIVGNDLRDIQQNDHTLTLGIWNKDKTNVMFEKFSKSQGKLSDYLVNQIMENLK